MPSCTQAVQRGDERIDIGAGIVKRQRRPDGRLMTKTTQDRLCAVMTAADGNAIGIERRPDVFITETVYDERQHSRLIRRCADETQTGDVKEETGSILQQIMFILTNEVQANPADIVDGGAKPDSVGDIPRPRFEF